MDPHEEIWPRETGQWYDIDKHTYTVDTFAPFEGLCGFSAHVSSYNGTLFRFPLRNEQRDKRVSKHIYDVNKLRSLLRALQEEAKCILLFLRSVRTVEVFEILRSGNHSNLLKMSICEASGDGLGPKRQRFQKNLEMLFEAQSFGIREKLSQIVHVQVDVNDYQQGTEGSSKWLVANQVGSQSAEVRKLANTLKVFPWVGVALETSADELEKSGGRVFCVLSMPQDVSCNLPVHVNGTFSLNDERRQLKWCGVERKNDPSAQWNHRLVEELLPPCYASLLLDHAKILLKPDQFCRAWPNTRRVKGTHWEGLLKPLLTALFAQSVIPFCKPGGLGAVTWLKVSSATFVPRGSTLPGVVSTALVACGVKLVTVSEEVWNALDHCRISVRSVTPSLTRSELKKSSHSYNVFSSAQKLELLRYCLSDNAYGDMHNLELLPLVNGNFGTFGLPSSAPVYLCTQQCPHYLLPSLEGELVDEKIETQLYMKLKTIAQGRNTNLQILTVNNVAALLPRAMPQEWQYQNTVTVSYSNFNMQWLKRFWQWVTGGNLYLFANQLLVPVSDTNVARFSKSSPTLFIPSTANCSQYLVSGLEKLQVQCCEQKRHQFVQHNSYISQLMNYFSPDGIIDVISCASPYYGNVSFMPQEARELIMHVHRVTLNPQRQTTLINIPMFATMKNTNESLYSVKQVEYSTGRMAQMEPPSFPLSPKNIPSTVVLFSHSNNYQRILLQGLSVQHTTTVDLLMYNLFPLIETGSMGRNAAKSLMTEVLEKFNDITSRTASQKKVDFQNTIARLSFVPVSVEELKAPNTLYSPDSELKNLFYQEPVFPLQPFSTGMCFSVLKQCGLKTTVSPQEIIEIIESISSPANTCPVPVDEVEQKRARAILSYVRNWGYQLSECVCIPGQSSYYFRRNVNFSAALKELSMTKSWLPVQCSPPTGYPSCLTWKGSGYTSHLVSYGPSVLLSRDQSSLAVACGSQMYFVEHSLQQVLCKEFTPESEEMVRHIMAHLEQVILNYRQFSRVEEVRKITQVIYQLLSKYHTEGASVDLSLLGVTEDCVWLTKQKKFVHPTVVALEQNSTFRQNLEPFIYILPDDLAEHESLFKALCVQQAVIRPQILGILGKIHNGDSQSLGVSNHQAWNMVMTILNWLTGNGEHEVADKDVEFLLVPVDSDTDWPTLVKVDDDVVYTDSDFLQRFLEGSNEGESEYTFVNHRISSKLAHQLRLTPLSKYLNISDDAFEDVGQSEPLTVRLKNILKDYKDGLTIIKELLQNADDAEASEMNICYDARCHTDKRRSLFFPGMAQCHGPALIVNNDAMFSKEDFLNITKLAGATKEGKVLKIGKFGVGFCSVYHITDIPSFVSNDLLYIFDPTLTYLKDEIKNPASPGKKVQFTSRFISRSEQLAPYIGLFEFNPHSQYKGTTFRFPFRKATSELSGKIYGEDDVKTLMEQIQKSSSKLLLFLQHVKLVTFSQIDSGQASPREIMRITNAKETITGHRCVHQITCSVNGSPDTTEFWMIETCTETTLEKYSTASVACALSPLSDRGIYKPKPVDGEVFCFLPLSIKTGLPVHVSSNFAVSNNRMGIWTSDENYVRSKEVEWNELLMKGTICSTYCELLEGLKEMQCNSKLIEYEFFSMWPVEGELRVRNPWYLCVESIYESISRRELFFSVSTEQWLTLDESRFLDPEILNVQRNPSLPTSVLDIANHLKLPVVHLPLEYHHDHLDLSGSTETEETFLEHFFTNIDQLHVIKESRNDILCLALKCYAHEMDRKSEKRFCYLKLFLIENACVPCEPDGDCLRKPDQLIHPGAYFAKLFDTDESLFPLETFCKEKLIEEAMKDLGMLYDSIPLQCLEERAAGIAELHKQDVTKALERAQLIIECLSKEDKHKHFSPESCSTIANVAFLPVLPKSADYPEALSWKGDKKRLFKGKDVLVKGHHTGDYTNINLASSQVVFLNQNLPKDGGCGFVGYRVQEILQIKSTPGYSEVVSHFHLLVEVFDGSDIMVKWADRISRKVYEFFENLLKPKHYGLMETQATENIDVSPLTERPCIWTGKQFVDCSAVAKVWTREGPYLYRVPNSLSTRRHLQRALNIKEEFKDEDLVQVLQYLKRDYGNESLQDSCQNLVKEIIYAIPLEGVKSDLKPIMLPDTNYVMHESTELYFNDMEWQSPEVKYTFVHGIVPLTKAKALGVQLCRKANLARYSIAGSGFKVMHFGQHEELTRRIQNIIRDYPFDITILKELLQNADDAKATKMYVILDMREHSREHVLSEEWSDLQGPALLVWNNSVFSEKDLEGIQRLGLGSKRSDSETIGQYGIGFNAVYHLTDCPSFLASGDKLCVLDPHMRYVPEATDRYPGAMYDKLDDTFWNTYDGLKSVYLRDGLVNRPKELTDGSLFRFPLRHTPKHVLSSDIVKDLPGQLQAKTITGDKMHTLLREWAPKMKQALLFLNNVRELKFFEIKDKRGVFSLQSSYRTELSDDALQCRQELSHKIRDYVETRDPYIATYPLSIVESVMAKGKEQKEEWLIQQGIGDVQDKEKTWSYVEQVKPRHGIAAPCKRDRAIFNGQVFCFLPLPLYSRLPVHINGHFILDSTRRNLWNPTECEKDDKSRWNENMLEAIASSYAHFLEIITQTFTPVETITSRTALERSAANYYLTFPRSSTKCDNTTEKLSVPWLQLVKRVYNIMKERNSSVLAVPINTSPKSSEDKYSLRWKELKASLDLCEHQAHFWKGTGKDMIKLRLILERIQMKITCAPLWIMNHFSDAECKIPIISPPSVFEYYTSFHKKLLHHDIPCRLENTPLVCVEDFKLFNKFLLEEKSSDDKNKEGFPKEPFGFPLLLTADGLLRVFDQKRKVLCSRYADLFPACPDRFLHKDLLGLQYSPSYFISSSDGFEVTLEVVKEVIDTVLPARLKDDVVYFSAATDILPQQHLVSLWKCFSEDSVFKSVLGNVLKEWALLFTRDNRLFMYKSSEQLLPIIPLATDQNSTEISQTYKDVSSAVEGLAGMPFLDTEVVPANVVLSLCPKFTDATGMLKNLYFLHKHTPFTATVTGPFTQLLIQYFNEINFKFDTTSCRIIKCLPLFETIDDTFTEVSRKTVYIWSGHMCKEGIQTWLKDTNVVFLKPKAAWSRLGIDSEIGIQKISPEMVYVQYVFPRFFSMREKQRYQHLKYIRDNLFNANYANQSSRNNKIATPAHTFIWSLRNLECIGGDDKPLKTINSFYTHKKKIFTTFPEHFLFLPKSLLQEDERYWMEFLRKLGLHENLTKPEYLNLCKDVASGKLIGKTRSASQVLLTYLFDQEEAELHQFHNSPQFLSSVSKVPFVCTVPLPELEWIAKVPEPAGHVLLANREKIILCTLSGSCLRPSQNLVWTVNPIVSVSKYESEDLLKNLGIYIEPTVQDVMQHIKNLSRSCFANSALLETYSAPQCGKDQTGLMDVFLTIIKFLHTNQSEVDFDKLKETRCIPVHATGKYPVLVEPYRVVCRKPEEVGCFYPYIHGVPDDLRYDLMTIMDVLGVKVSIQMKHMQVVLESVFKYSQGKRLDINSCKIIENAVEKLYSLLKHNEEEKILKMGEDAISQQLSPLYLSGVDRKMHSVDTLVYSQMRDIKLGGTNLYLLWTPRGIFAKSLCEMLPEQLRPKPLSQLCIWKVAEPVVCRELTECANRVNQVLQLPALSQGMCTVVKHITGSSEVSETFDKHLENILGTLQICCIKGLRIKYILKDTDKTVAVESRKCFIEDKKLSFCLYIDSNVTPMDICDIRNCIADLLASAVKTELHHYHVKVALEYLLRANSSDDVYKYLREKEIEFTELDCSMEINFLTPKLGNKIPRSCHFMLDDNNNNLFRPQEWVGYEIEEGEVIFAQVVYPVRPADSEGQPVKPMHIKYVIFVNEDDEEGTEVTATEIFKFKLDKEQAQASSSTNECRDLAPYAGGEDDLPPTSTDIPPHLQQARDKIREELRDIWQLPEADRKRAIRRLYLKYHPDKNTDNQELAEEAFKFLLEEIDRLEAAGSSVSSWRDYTSAWDRSARDQRYYSEQYYRSSSQDGWSGGGGGWRCGGGGFASNFPRQNRSEAERWMKQAEADLEALEALLVTARLNDKLSCHVCFMAHEVAEKALKGGMYATCGLGENSLKSHNLGPLGHSIEAERPQVARGLAALTAPLEPYYLDTRFPNRWSYPTVPFEQFNLQKAEGATMCARDILDIVRKL